MPSHLQLFIGNHISEAQVYAYLIAAYPKTKKASWLSKKAIQAQIQEERIHDLKLFVNSYGQTLESMSSGQQRMAFFKHMLTLEKETIVLINPMAHLDAINRASIEAALENISSHVKLVIVSPNDYWKPSFNTTISYLEYAPISEDSDAGDIKIRSNLIVALEQLKNNKSKKAVPETLIKLENVTVSYGEKKILDRINWTIKSGDFWQLKGENGSGKTTLLSLITGDNPKGFGQDLWLFGHKKGSGESVWDIKKHIGYYAPSMVQMFPGTHSVLEMVLGGVLDQIGLYNKPSETMVQGARMWLESVGLSPIEKRPFHSLSEGQKGIVMTLRAMIKFPKLLILDEPTSGLDSIQTTQYTALLNTISQHTETAIVVVSHIEAQDFIRAKQMVLQPTVHGSRALII